MKNNNKGITLVALVITIIVLLILAGVTIASLSGDNGILTRGKQSKIENEIGNAKDIINLAINEGVAAYYGKTYGNVGYENAVNNDQKLDVVICQYIDEALTKNNIAKEGATGLAVIKATSSGTTYTINFDNTAKHTLTITTDGKTSWKVGA